MQAREQLLGSKRMVGLNWIKASAAARRGALSEVGPMDEAGGQSFQGRTGRLAGTAEGQWRTSHSDGQ